jgi:hypothetical protein
MIAAFLRVLVLAAMMLMPLGMPAAAASAPSAAAASAGHCTDDHQQQPEGPAESQLHCAACAALPAPAAGEACAYRPAAEPLVAAQATAHRSLEPEIITPPPKRL